MDEERRTEIKGKYIEFLSKPDAPIKIPYIECVPELTEYIPVTYNTTAISGTTLTNSPTLEALRYVNIKMLNKSRESIVQIYQRALPIKKFGRLRGNMEYLEDA
jgi:hypothetical protein